VRHLMLVPHFTPTPDPNTALARARLSVHGALQQLHALLQAGQRLAALQQLAQVPARRAEGVGRSDCKAAAGCTKGGRLSALSAESRHMLCSSHPLSPYQTTAPLNRAPLGVGSKIRRLGYSGSYRMSLYERP